MEWMEMRCRLTKCEIDGTTEMDPSKCLNDKGEFRICYQLALKKHQEAEKGEVWKKLEEIIDKDKQRKAPPQNDII